MKSNSFNSLTYRLIFCLLIFAIVISALNIWGIKPVSAETANFWVFLIFNDCSRGEIQGYGWPAGATVHLTIDDPATPGEPDYLAADQVFDEDGHGTFGLEEIPGFAFQTGYIIRMWDGTTDLSHTVTALCATRVNVITDQVSGTAEPGSTLEISVESEYRTTLVDPSGNWTEDFSVADNEGETVIDILPGMHIMGSQSNGGGVTGFSWHVNNPWFYVFLGKDSRIDDIHGYDWPLNLPVTLTLTHPGAGSPYYTIDKYMEVQFWGGNKQLFYDLDGVIASTGDIVTMSDGFTADLTHTIASLHVYSVNTITNSVIGTAEPGSIVRVDTDSAYRNETAAADGSWVAHFSVLGNEPEEEIADITPGSKVHISQSNGGGTTDLPWDILNPCFDVWLNPDGTLQALPAYGWPTGLPVTIRMFHEGVMYYTDTMYPNDNGYGSFNTEGVTIAPGDYVTMTDGVTAMLSHTITWLTVSGVNIDTDIITGSAVPGSTVHVSVENNPAFRDVIAGVNGVWSADFSVTGDEPGEEVFDITPGLWLQIYQSNGAGITAYRWEIQNFGVITGTVQDLEGDPITGTSISVEISSGQSTCTDPDNGTYILTQLPIDTELFLTANFNQEQCGLNNYGWEAWEHKTSGNSTPIVLSSSNPQIDNIDFTIGTYIPGIEYFWFNLNQPIMNDPAIRKAIGFGTDRLRLLRDVWIPAGNIGTLQNTYVHSEHWAHADDIDLDVVYSFNPEQARTILQNAGWIDTDMDGIREKGGQELRLRFRTSPKPERVQGAEIFVQNMLDIGISIDAAYALFDQIGNEYEIIEYTIAKGGPMFCASLEDRSCVPNITFVTGNNDIGYSNPESDALYASAQAATTLEEIKSLAIQHQNLISNDIPVLPLFSRVNGYSISGKTSIQGVELTYAIGEDTLSAFSDGSGVFAFPVPYGWTGTITPFKAGWIFNPTSVTINYPVTSEITGVNFTATRKPGKFNKTSPGNTFTNQPVNPTLTWETSENAAQYDYCIDTTSGTTCNATWISTGMDTSVTLSALTPGSYYWQVRAKNPYGYTYANNSSWWSFTILPLPGIFQKLKPLNNALNQRASPTLSWTASSDAVEYDYCISVSTSDCTPWVSAGSNTSVTLTGLTPAKYKWQIRALNATGTTYADDGVLWYFTVPPKPGAFSKISPLNNATAQPTILTLKWGASTNAAKYEYCLDTTAGTTCTTSWKSTKLIKFVNLTGLLKNKKYYWMVRAVNSTGTTLSNGGVWWSFTTKP